MNKLATLSLMVLSFLLLQGCATIMGRWHNTLVFENESGQSAQVYLDGNHIGDAPGKIKLDSKKIQHGSNLEIRAEGQETQEYMILRKPNKLYIAADAITGGIWLGIDFSTGQIYRPYPRKFNYVLNNQ